MAYRRMQQYNNLQTDHEALAACLQERDRDCSREQALYDADAGATGSMTHGNSRVSVTAIGAPVAPTRVQPQAAPNPNVAPALPSQM